MQNSTIDFFPDGSNYYESLILVEGLEKRFLQLLESLNSVAWIRQGGCGIAVYTIYKWFVQQNALPHDFKFVFTYLNDSETFDHNNKILTNNSNKFLLVPSHIIVFLNNSYYDLDGKLSNLFENNLYHETTDATVILNMINEAGDEPSWKENWNAMFNRFNNVPFIEELTGVSLSEIKTT